MLAIKRAVEPHSAKRFNAASCNHGRGSRNPGSSPSSSTTAVLHRTRATPITTPPFPSPTAAASTLPLTPYTRHVPATISIHDLHAEAHGTDEVSPFQLPETRLHEISRFVQGHAVAKAVVEKAQREPRGEAVRAEGDVLEGAQSVQPEKVGLTSNLL